MRRRAFWSAAAWASRFASSCSYIFARSIFIAFALFECWLRSFWHCTTRPVGRCVMRTAESVLLTCWPPGGGTRPHAREPMHAVLGFEQAVRVVAGHDDRRALDAGLFGHRLLDELD